MRTCHLHIGLHKTGSTTLQTMILANHARLAAHGIYVPRTRTDGYARAHHQLAWELLGQKTRDVAAGGFDELRTELAARAMPDDILVSSEDFEWCLASRPRLRRLRNVFTEMGYRLRLIAYVRPQIASINSVYAQVTKTLSNTAGFEAFVADAIGLRRFDYASALLPLLDMKRIEVAFLPFNREAVKRGISQDFLAALGLDEAAIAGMDIPDAKNVRPGPKTVAACRELACRLADSGIALDPVSRRLASRAVLRLSEQSNWNETGFSGIGAVEAETMRKHFAEGNAVFAQRVWNRSWEDVYGADCWTAPPLSTFERETADPRDASDFDHVVEGAWRRLKARDAKGLASDAGLPPDTAAVRGWLGQLKASLAG